MQNTSENLIPLKWSQKMTEEGPKIALWESKLRTYHIYKYRLGNNQKNDLNKTIKIKTTVLQTAKFTLLFNVIPKGEMLSLTIPQLVENFCPVWDITLQNK